MKLSQEYAADLPVLIARHNAILKQAVEAYGGFIFQRAGDSFAVAFDTAQNALIAAVEAQRMLQKEKWTPAVLKVRMGIHTGSAQLKEITSGNEPYEGYTTLATSQRIMSVAHGGQVLLSQATRDLVWDQLSPDIGLLDMGEHRLKDLQRSIHIYQIVAKGVTVDFPPLRTLNAFPNNIPLELTSFIGREREIEEIRQIIDNTRLLTLIGPGGTGKTRLSLKVAGNLLSAFKDGAWLVELAPISDITLIPQAIASVFDLRELPNRSLNQVVTDYLQSKELLLILDNCEHLVEACARLSENLLHNCPDLKILASSREALGIRGETVYRVPSLSLPDLSSIAEASLRDSEAVQLFVERATAVHSRFQLSEQNAPFIGQICHRLDGIPLALELAAARVTVFSPEQISSRLDDRFKLLTGGSRTALERHQTLQALIDWSYDLLSSEERALFRRLSVFAGGWTFAAAEAICPDLDILDLLPHLINKSLVLLDERSDESRYHFPETIRQYARDKLLESGEAEQTRSLHLHFFLQLAEQAETHFNSFQEMAWIRRLDEDNDNLHTAVEWALERDVLIALRLVTTLSTFWSRYGYEAEGVRMLREALARFHALPPVEGEAARQSIEIKVKALGALEVLNFATGDFISSVNTAEEVIRLSRQIGEKHELSMALSYLGIVKAFLGDTETSYSFVEEALNLAREIGDKVLLGLSLTMMAGVLAMTQKDMQKIRSCAEEGARLLREAGAQWGAAMATFGTGLFASRQGNYAEARSQFEASIPIFTELKDRHRVNMAYSEIAHMERRQGYFKEAKVHYRRTLLEWQRLGHRAAIAHELECFAFIAKAEENEERAAILLGAAEILREMTRLPMTPMERVEYEGEVSDLQSQMDPSAFQAVWSKGRAMSMEQAILIAVEQDIVG
jgi:predicted ATPase